MTEHRFTDALVHDGQLRKTDDGHVVQARVARGGNVQAYLGAEMGIADKQIVRVYRPSEAVFARDAIQTYARKPITLGHPAEGVSADTWKDLAVGEIDRDVMRDGEFVSVPLLFRDAKAVALMQSADGPRELSMGYDAKVEMRDGVTPEGEPYDAVMTDFRMNHVAVVAQARGGSELRIGDDAGKWGAAPIPVSDKKEDPMSDALKTVVLGDKAAQIAVADAQIIEQFKADQAKALTDAQTAHNEAIEAKDEEIGTLKADLKKAKDAAITPDKVSQLVADRVALETAVRAVDAEMNMAGLSDADLRKAAVAKAWGDEFVKDASEAEIKGMFRRVAADAAKGDPFANAVKDGKTTPNVTSLDQAYADRNRSLSDAWKGEPAKKEG